MDAHAPGALPDRRSAGLPHLHPHLDDSGLPARRGRRGHTSESSTSTRCVADPRDHRGHLRVDLRQRAAPSSRRRHRGAEPPHPPATTGYSGTNVRGSTTSSPAVRVRTSRNCFDHPDSTVPPPNCLPSRWRPSHRWCSGRLQADLHLDDRRPRKLTRRCTSRPARSLWPSASSHPASAGSTPALCCVRVPICTRRSDGRASQACSWPCRVLRVLPGPLRRGQSRRHDHRIRLAADRHSRHQVHHPGYSSEAEAEPMAAGHRLVRGGRGHRHRQLRGRSSRRGLPRNRLGLRRRAGQRPVSSVRIQSDHPDRAGDPVPSPSPPSIPSRSPTRWPWPRSCCR